ncbi:hypothetical protein MLD38_012647 [Melastoma candidum]|uniref:Uncharacterized protein n=1 Tax=Melastoma candidum TaxID=119954 RepID=A0ACB9R714_9MYRT|nr:hypothetical protein MLD38_012647 [Melastoma candidum]
MARRSHVTELGCIACEELSDIGAGKEGWLVDNPDLLTALDTRCLAIATKSLILLIPWSDHPYPPRLKIRPELSPIEAEHITAVEWLVFDEIRVIGVGTSRGYLLLYSLDGDLIHKQIVHTTRILKIRVRGRRGILGLMALLRRLPYQLWNVNKFGTCADTAITGIMPPPLVEAQSSQRYYCAITTGDDAVISAFRLSEDRNTSIVGAILSKVVPATFSTIYSLSKRIWRSEQSPTEKSEVKPQPFARASPLTCLKDHPRKGEKLTLSPSGTLAAITDSLGRILLLDTRALVVVRLWKGYRDANCLFMEMLVNRNSGASSSSKHETTKSDYSLCLAIHAPRKGIIEVWEMRTGPRVMAISCAKGCKIVQPTYRHVNSR